MDTKELRKHLEGALSCLDAMEQGGTDEPVSAAPEEGPSGAPDVAMKTMKAKLSKYGQKAG